MAMGKAPDELVYKKRAGDICEHHDDTAGEAAVVRPVVPDERQHQDVRQWQPDPAELAGAWGIRENHPPCDEQVRFSVPVCDCLPVRVEVEVRGYRQEA